MKRNIDHACHKECAHPEWKGRMTRRVRMAMVMEVSEISEVGGLRPITMPQLLWNPAVAAVANSPQLLQPESIECLCCGLWCPTTAYLCPKVSKMFTPRSSIADGGSMALNVRHK